MTDATDPTATLRRAAERLRGLRDVDMEELALASRLDATANALDGNVAVTGLDATLRIARTVLTVHGDAK